MRAIAILCSVFVTADAGDWDKSDEWRFCKAGQVNADKRTYYDADSMRLTCVDGDTSLMAVEWRSSRARALRCDHLNHWHREGDICWKEPCVKPYFWRPDPKKQLAPIWIKCVEYCAVSGARIVSEVNGEVNVVKCPDGDKMFINNAPIDTSELRCSFHSGWVTKNESKIATDTATTLQADCKKPCGQGQWADGIQSTVDSTKTIIKCNKPNNGDEKYGIRVNGGAVYSHLYCNKMDGYFDGANNVVVADAYKTVNVECSVGDVCSFNAENSTIYFDSATKTLTCINEANKLMAIEFSSKRYKSLKCDEFNGWKKGSETIADAFTPINVKCVEYCAVETAGDAIPNTIQSGTRTISCLENPENIKIAQIVEKNLVLVVNDKPLYRADFYATCNFDNGWNNVVPSADRLHNLLFNDTNTPIRAECKRACVQITQTDDITATKYHSLHGDTEFSCHKLGKGYGTRINGGAVHPKIMCSVKGFTLDDSRTSKVIASAFEPANLDCAPFPTTTKSTTTSITTTTSASNTLMVPQRPTEKDDTIPPEMPSKPTGDVPERPTEKVDTVPPNNPSKPTEDDDGSPRSTKSSIFSISIYSIALILAGYTNL